MHLKSVHWKSSKPSVTGISENTFETIGKKILPFQQRKGPFYSISVGLSEASFLNVDVSFVPASVSEFQYPSTEANWYLRPVIHLYVLNGEVKKRKKKLNQHFPKHVFFRFDPFQIGRRILQRQYKTRIESVDTKNDRFQSRMAVATYRSGCQNRHRRIVKQTITNGL